MKTFQDFLSWEHATRDTIDFKKIYVDIAGDILAGLVLSEIVYWHMPSKQGVSRLSVQRDGYEWIACHRAKWWDRTRMTPRQIDRVFNVLIKKGLIVKARYKFAGSPTVHVRLNKEAFLTAWDNAINNPMPNPFSPNGEIEITEPLNGIYANGEIQFTENVNSYTETTAKTTNKKRASRKSKGMTKREKLLHDLEPFKELAAAALELVDKGYTAGMDDPEHYMTVVHLEKYLPGLEELHQRGATPEKLRTLYAHIKPIYDKNKWVIGFKTLVEKYPAFENSLNGKADTDYIPVEERTSALDGVKLVS